MSAIASGVSSLFSQGLGLIFSRAFSILAEGGKGHELRNTLPQVPGRELHKRRQMRQSGLMKALATRSVLDIVGVTPSC